MDRKLFWVFALSSLVYFTQGIETLPGQGLFYYLKETLNYPAEKIMLITSITSIAWLIKPIIGYIIDNFFSKKIWIFIALGFDIILVWLIWSLQMPIFILIILLLLNSTNAAFRDVAVDGIMCVEGKKNKTTGKIQSIQWISISIAGLISGILGGYIAQKWDYRLGFLCLVPVYLLTGITAHFYRENGKPENMPAPEHIFLNLKRLFSDKKLLIIGLFIFLYKYSPSFGTPLFFIQRDSFKWGKVWIGAMATLGTAFEICGAILYYKFSKKIKIKKWLYFSVFLGALVSLTYLYYTPLTAVIYNILYGLIGMFIFLMILDFMARNSTKGLEATSFALLCSISNLAQTASNLSGAFLLPVIGLNWLIVISSLTSFLCLFLINKIPDV